MSEANNINDALAKANLRLLECEKLVADLQKKNDVLAAELNNANALVSLANASPNSIFQFDSTGNIEFLNLAAKKLMLVTNEEYIGKNIAEFVSNDDAESVINILAKTLKTQQRLETNIHIKDKLLKVVADTIKSNNNDRILFITSDLTEQTKYEEELKYKSKLLQKIYDDSPDCLLIIDLETSQLRSYNKTTLTLFELEDTATFEEVSNYVFHARKQPLTEQEINDYRRKLFNNERYSGETEYLTKKGVAFKASFHASTFELNNRRKVLVRISDITQIKQINKVLNFDKQKQKLYIEQSPLGYLEWNTNFEVAEWNVSAEKIFGYTKAEAMGKHASFIIQDSEKAFSDDYWQTLVANKNGSRSTHFNINKNNELISIEWYNSPVYDEAGMLLGISSLIDNVTNKLNAEQELKNKTAFLETIYEEAFDGIMLFKSNSFEIITCNKRSYQMFEVDNLEQLNILMPNARKYKQSKEERNEMFEKIAEGQVHDKDIEFITNKGNSIWLTLLVKLIEYNGETVELVRVTDVTDLKKINSQLNLDKQKQKIQVEQSPLGYIEWNNKFEVAEWNPSVAKIFGYTKEEAIGKSASFILADYEKKNIAIIWQTILSHISGHRGVYNNINKQGEILTIEWYDTPLFDEYGNVLGVSSLVNNITEKIKHEEDLQYKTSFLETIYEEAFDGIMLFKPNSFEVLTCNKRSYEIFETENLEQLNKIMPHARKIKQSTRERNDMFDEIAQGEVYDKDIEFITYKGNTVWLTLLVKLIMLNGETVELVRVTDVSELKKINSKLNLDKQKQRLQVEQSPLGYIEWNTNFEVAAWNPSAEKIFGYTKAEAMGKSAIFIIPDDVKPLVQEVWESLKSRKGGYRSTNDNINKNGEVITLEWYNTPLFDEDGKLLGVSSLIDDITEQIKAQTKIENQLKEKEILLSEIHHRVKNNLAVISGLLFMHAEHLEDEGMKQILKESQSRIKSMAIIHEQLYQTENFGNINVNEYLKELVKKISNSFGIKNKVIDVDVEVNDFSMPISQALIIGLIINELVVNAYKYAFPYLDHGKIKVRFHKKGMFILRVNDNGVGYKENYNFEKSSTLGLNLVKILAKQLKGDVLFENKKGAYCTLIFN